MQMQAILDRIRANASTEYQDRVPVAERNAIQAVGDPILTYENLQNEFLNALIYRIAFSIIQNKIAKNPLAPLKKGSVPLGSDIQEIFTNMAKDTGFDGTGSKLLTKTTPDVKALYHRLSRKGQYPVSVTPEMLQTAFTSYGELESMVNSIVTSMYSGDNYDEFILMKNLFATAVEGDKVVKVSVNHVTDEATGKAFIKAVKKASKAFTFPSSAFNKYYENRPEIDLGRPVTTWTPLEDQIFVVRADVMEDLSVDVLASAFNVDKVTFMANYLEVDSFGSATNVLGVLCDRSFVQVYDNLFKVTEFNNGQGLFHNYWLNHWQTYGFSLFANCVAFTCDNEAVSLTQSTLSFATTATQTITVASKTPSNAVLTWLSSDETVATVDETGIVTPHDNGTCIISAINGDSVDSVVVTVNIP